MRPIRALLLLLAAALAAAGAPARAQPVTSPGPDSVAVTVYRDPDRRFDTAIDLAWLRGYALVTERRTVTIPAGRAVIRFEGVAGGILPESAIVTGLPAGVREKNLDADLLNPRSLFARSYGRPVTLRRTIKGQVVEERAIIRSGPDGAAILQTQEGFEAVDCGPQQDRMLYDSVPSGLAAKPTLSIETDSPVGGQVTITLSYLAWGFDWQANYVATMRPDGASADLFAWVTLASSDVTSFPDAETLVIAGRINRDDAYRQGVGGVAPPLVLHCYPRPVDQPRARAFERNSDGMVDAITADDIGALPAPAAIVVTGIRAVAQEDLGDLKLYRVPDRTTLASMSQKQVALLDKPGVPVDVLYRAIVQGGMVSPAVLTLRAQNRKERGLGLPLPAGPVAVFASEGGRSLLLGEGAIGDKAVNEEVEIGVARATQVQVADKRVATGRGWAEYELTVTNAEPHPVRFEAEIGSDTNAAISRYSAKLGRKNGHDLWAVDVPANGSVTLRYRVTEIARH